MLAWSWQDFDDMVRLLERDVSEVFGRTMLSASKGNGRRRLVPAIDCFAGTASSRSGSSCPASTRKRWT
jgi:hypothetical protein